MTDRMQVWTIEIYETVAVTPLPTGWVNIYIEEDGTELESHCPALLLQEHRETHHCEAPNKPALGPDWPKVTVTHRPPPYATRVVFAHYEAGELEPALDIGNYKETRSPNGQLPVARAEQ